MANSDKVTFAAGTTNIILAIQTLDADDAMAVMTLVGPAYLWFGVSFGAHSMCRHLKKTTNLVMASRLRLR